MAKFATNFHISKAKCNHPAQRSNQWGLCRDLHPAACRLLGVSFSSLKDFDSWSRVAYLQRAVITRVLLPRWLSCPGGKCWMGAVPSPQSKIHWHLRRFSAYAKLEFVLVQQLLYKELSYSCKGAQQTAGWRKQCSYSKVNCLYLGIRVLREWKILMDVIIVNWMTENVSVTWLCVICCCLSSL